MFEFLKIITLRATYECQTVGYLPPYLGSTVRGILGHCIRDFCCNRQGEKCFRCERKEDCLYVQCFSNTGGEAGAVNGCMSSVDSARDLSRRCGEIKTPEILFWDKRKDRWF